MRQSTIRTRSQTVASQSLCDLKAHDLVIDLTDINVVLSFAECVRCLNEKRRKTIWDHNVKLNNKVQTKTKLQHQIDDILLFLIIIYGKEQYPDEEEELIAKLKLFINSEPFTNMKNYVHDKYFPLLSSPFINDDDYFASMIEEYAENNLTMDELVIDDEEYDRYSNSPFMPQSVQQSINTQYGRLSTKNSTRSVISDSVQSHSHSQSHNKKYSPTYDHVDIYTHLEDKINEIVNAKVKELEDKINTIQKEVYAIKHALSEDAKNDHQSQPTDDIMEQIVSIKKEMKKIKANSKKSRSNEFIKPNSTKSRSSKKASKSKSKSTKKTIITTTADDTAVKTRTFRKRSPTVTGSPKTSTSLSSPSPRSGKGGKSPTKGTKGSKFKFRKASAGNNGHHGGNGKRKKSTASASDNHKSSLSISSASKGVKPKRKTSETIKLTKAIKAINKKSSKSAKQMKSSKRQQLKTWLCKECELEEYYELFVEHGLEDLATMKSVTISDLALIGINKVGHRVKIMQNIQKLRGNACHGQNRKIQKK